MPQLADALGPRAQEIPVTAIARAVVERAEELGLLWHLRPATMAAAGPYGEFRAVLDGDVVPIRVVSMLGPVPVGVRVMVLVTPPAGYHLVGWAADPPFANGDRRVASSVVSSAAIGTVQAAVLTITNFLFKAGRAYRISFLGGVASSAAGTIADFRVHRTGGAVVTEFYRFRTEGGTVMNAEASRVLVRSAETDLVASMDLMFSSATVGQTVTFYANANVARTFTLEDIGRAADHPYAKAVV